MSSLSKRAAPRGPGARPSPYGFPGRLLWRARPGRMEEMTVPLDTVNDIRSMDAAGRSRSEIARMLHVSRNTVAKYADMEDMSPAAPMPRRRGGRSAGRASPRVSRRHARRRSGSSRAAASPTTPRSTCWRDASREAAAGPAGPTCRSTTGS